MHPDVKRLLDENAVPAEPEALDDLERLTEALHGGSSESYLRGVNAFRLFVHEPPDAGRRLPGDSFYRLILGHGKKGFEALVSAFMATRNDAPDGQGAIRNEVATLLAIPRRARALGLIPWDADDYNPAAESKQRLTVRLPADLRERVTRAAFEERATLSAFVETALRGTIEGWEREHGRIAPREAGASA